MKFIKPLSFSLCVLLYTTVYDGGKNVLQIFWQVLMKGDFVLSIE